MTDLSVLVWLLLAALVLLVLALLVLWRRASAQPDWARQLQAAAQQRNDLVGAQLGEATRELRDTVHASARDGRSEQAQALALMQQALLTQSGDAVRTQNEQIDSFRVQLASLQQHLAQALQGGADAQAQALHRLGEQVQAQLQAVSQRTEQRLAALQEGNEKKLDQMRAVVDEKLHATLEQRLTESFRQVAERLEWVHKGLGEMQALARDVGSLNRTLTGVKTRGLFGETQLAALLEQVFTPEQYAANVAVVPGSNERVDFALRLPGRAAPGGGVGNGSSGDAPLWLPIDAKFPREDYERLLEAQQAADRDAADTAGKALEARLRLEAKSIRAKYIAPPHTTDFALIFVPSEGLYAELLRRPGLVEEMQRQHQVMLAGPTTLHAILGSIQMGFRTLALEQRSAEVWEVLGAVQTEFGKFGEALAHTKKKLDEAASSIDKAQTRTRMMRRALKGVEALPAGRTATLLGGAGVEGDAAEDGL